MAVTNRFFGLDYAADRSTVTTGAATTSKDIEIRFAQGDAAGSAGEIAESKVYRDKESVIADLMVLVEEIKTARFPWPAATS